MRPAEYCASCCLARYCKRLHTPDIQYSIALKFSIDEHFQNERFYSSAAGSKVSSVGYRLVKSIVPPTVNGVVGRSTSFKSRAITKIGCRASRKH